MCKFHFSNGSNVHFHPNKKVSFPISRIIPVLKLGRIDVSLSIQRVKTCVIKSDKKKKGKKKSINQNQ